ATIWNESGLVLSRIGGSNPERDAREPINVTDLSELDTAWRGRQTKRAYRWEAQQQGSRTLGRPGYGERVDVTAFSLRRHVSRSHQANCGNGGGWHLVRRAAL